MSESNERPPREGRNGLDRRDFLRISAAVAAAGVAAGALRPVRASAAEAPVLIDDFGQPDSLYAGDGWESMNPGYWRI